MGNPRGVKRDFQALENRRLEAYKLLKQGVHQSEVARQLNVGRQSVSRWAAALKKEGVSGLHKAGRAGRKPRLSQKQTDKLKTDLLKGAEAFGYRSGLWTVTRVRALIKETTGQQFHSGHVWKILRALGWSPQKPMGRAIERNEEEITRWKKNTWPAIKKKPATRAEP